MPDLDDDDLSKDIMAAMNEGGSTPDAPGDEGSQPEKVEKPASDDAKASSGPARDEKGKFAAKATDAPDVVKADIAPDPAVQKDAVQPEAKEADIPAPLNWKGSAKVNWQRLPKEVRQAIIEDYSGQSKTSSELEEYRSALGDRAQFLAAQYGSVGNGLKSILAGADMANKNPENFILWLAQRAGVDLSRLVQGNSQGQGQAGIGQHDPNYQPNPIEQKLSALEQTLTGYLQQQHQTQSQTLKSQIEAFAADPSHPYFEDVRADMALLVKEGRAKGLEDAYEAAVWANPETRKHLLEEERKRVAEGNVKRVDTAKKASGSLSGAPGSRKPSDASTDETLDETIRRAISESSGQRRVA